MKVIWFNGNLGNQIFYCKYKDYLKQAYPKHNVYAYIDSKCPKVNVDRFFNIELPKQHPLINVLSFFVFKVLGAILRRISRKFTPKWYCEEGELNDMATFFGHNLQTCSYYKHESSDWLQIKMPHTLSPEYTDWAAKITTENSVAIHLRRGDYVRPGSAYVDLSATNYYEKAMDKARELLPDCQFFFFSDDLDYVKSKFKGDNIHYVDCNRGENSYLDIKLMSMAKVNIMANSTFSYWGAYIGHEKKTVIYSDQWFCEKTGRSMPPIMLDNWICIKSFANQH